MKILESFTVYHCTQCDKFHISDMDYDSVFQPHSEFHDSHGIVTRYRLNDKLDTAMFAATAVFAVGWFIYVAFRAVSAWPNKPEWGTSFGVTAGLCFSAVWLMFVHEQTFGPSPWRKEQHKSGWLWNEGWVVGLTFMAAGLLMIELLVRGRLTTLLDWALLVLCIVLAESFVLMRVFAKGVLDVEIQERSWTSLLFWTWAIITFGLWAGPHKQPFGAVPWDKSAVTAAAIVLAFAAFSLLLVGIIKAVRYCGQWVLVQFVRSWRHAERIVDERETK